MRHVTTIPALETDLSADALPLRDAVIADGLVLTTSPARTLTLHTLERGQAQLVGSFRDVRDAWAAVDALDGFQADLPAAA